MISIAEKHPNVEKTLLIWMNSALGNNLKITDYVLLLNTKDENSDQNSDIDGGR